jgi:hypothetical protein
MPAPQAAEQALVDRIVAERLADVAGAAPADHEKTRSMTR